VTRHRERTSEGSSGRRPILVLGLGNLLLGDDAVGLHVLDSLGARRLDPRVELVDGGTLGLALLPLLEQREALILLDAARLGGEAGQVHVLPDIAGVTGARGHGAHEGNAFELLDLARLLKACPKRVALVGIEPGVVRTTMALSDAVADAIPGAVGAVLEVLDRELANLDTEAEPCTS